jgi:hypothetical protein
VNRQSRISPLPSGGWAQGNFALEPQAPWIEIEIEIEIAIEIVIDS